MGRPENFYGPYTVPIGKITPELEAWLREHTGPLDWHITIPSDGDDRHVVFYLRDAEVGTLFALTWS
jgi:hypothetical protein